MTVDNVGLVNFMGQDSLDVVLEDLYTYFHFSNIGKWDAMFEHFPGHRTADQPCSLSKRNDGQVVPQRPAQPRGRMSHSLRKPLDR